MQHLRVGFLHSAWADNLLFEKLQECPEAALGWHYADPQWPITRIAMHIVEGAEWYRYVLSGKKWTEFEYPKTWNDLEVLRIKLAETYQDVFTEIDQADELIVFEDENGPRQAMRSTVLNQIPYHSTEHRAQIFVALQINGYNNISADDFDVWAYENSQK
jgi:uncharacterized damage-inducible protein DinB